MIGYIKAYKPELRIKEYDFYKATYCALCRDMGRRYGVFTRFFLSYDFTFLALLKISLSPSVINVKKRRCTCNPLKKCNFCVEEDGALFFSSAVSVIMTYYKLTDNTVDERGIKKAVYKIIKLFYSSSYKKARRDFPDIDKAVSAYFESQIKLERENCRDLDAAAQPTADILSYIFESCSDDENDRRALSRLGFCMGRYIYLCDAYFDREKDLKKGRYNPLSGEENADERIERNIFMCISEAEKSFELINIQKLKNILGNIIYLGLEDTYKRGKNK